MMDHAENPHRELFDEFGNYRKQQAVVVEEHYVDTVLDEGSVVDRCVRYVNQADLNKCQAQPEARHVKPGERDWETLRRFFGWASVNLEPVATDYVYADVPAVDDGSMGAQIFVGTESEVCDAQGLKSPKQFVNSLEDNIRKCGAMDKLLSDRAQTEIGTRAQDILRALFISSWQSEPHRQQQNRLSASTRCLSGTLIPYLVVLVRLCLLYICFLLNRLACQSLQWRTPLALEGSTPDISP